MDDIKELELRRSFCEYCITVLESIVDDPRKDSALVEYRKQLENINKRIEETKSKPEDIVIGLKPAILFGRTGGNYGRG